MANLDRLSMAEKIWGFFAWAIILVFALLFVVLVARILWVCVAWVWGLV